MSKRIEPQTFHIPITRFGCQTCWCNISHQFM